jgi:hypothetical protein
VTLVLDQYGVYVLERLVCLDSLVVRNSIFSQETI